MEDVPWGNSAIELSDKFLRLLVMVDRIMFELRFHEDKVDLNKGLILRIIVNHIR